MVIVVKRKVVPARGPLEGAVRQTDDLNPHSVCPALAPEGARSGGPGKQKWLPSLWLPDGEAGQSAAANPEPGDGRKEERKEQAPGLMEKILSDENAALALLAIQRNGGAAGIDGMETEQLRPDLEKHWLKIHASQTCSVKSARFNRRMR